MPQGRSVQEGRHSPFPTNLHGQPATACQRTGTRAHGASQLAIRTSPCLLHMVCGEGEEGGGVGGWRGGWGGVGGLACKQVLWGSVNHPTKPRNTKTKIEWPRARGARTHGRVAVVRRDALRGQGWRWAPLHHEASLVVPVLRIVSGVGWGGRNRGEVDWKVHVCVWAAPQKPPNKPVNKRLPSQHPGPTPGTGDPQLTAHVRWLHTH